MTRLQFSCTCFIIISLTIATVIRADLQDFMNLQHRRTRLPDTKFGYSEYSEYPENEDRERGPEASWNRIPQRNIEPPIFPDALDPNIVWDEHWTADLDIGQLSAVAMEPNGNVAIFSRRDRVWGLGSFDERTNKFDCSYGPIKQNPIVVFDTHGKQILQWGKNLFYMPHGLTIDSDGNYWLTDVALHQVFKFDAIEIEKNLDRLKSAEKEPEIGLINVHDHQSRFNRSILKPSMILGVAFEPGDDNKSFCKPTAVAVATNGDFFVSDGYCNSRIVKFNKKGERILHWGRAWNLPGGMSNKSPPSYAMFVPHALALAEEKNLIYVADRENGRVMSYNALNGTFHREYEHPAIGTKIYSIAYAREKIYLVNGMDVWASSKFHVRGFVIDVKSGGIVSQFSPGRDDMLAPHDIAVSVDGTEIYVVELDAKKIYRFLQGKSNSTLTLNVSLSSHHEHVPLTDDTKTDGPADRNATGPLVLSIIVSAMILIGLCLAVAALVARCRKRGKSQKDVEWEHLVD